MSNSAYNKITEYDQAAPVDEASEELLEWVLQDLREDLSYEVNRIQKPAPQASFNGHMSQLLGQARPML